MDTAKVAKALSDPLRLDLLQRIAQGQGVYGGKGMCVCHLVDETGLLQSKISYHIKELKEADLIREEIRGRWNFYYLNEETLKEYLAALKEKFLL